MEKVLLVWHNLTAEQREELHLLPQHPTLIAELIEMTRLIKDLSSELKTKGITQESEKRVRDILGNLAGKAKNIIDFEQKRQTYLAEKKRILPQAWSGQGPGQEVISCCSDVIESFFVSLTTAAIKAAQRVCLTT